MPIDQSKLKQFEEHLDERSQGTSIFFNASKIQGSQDVRVLDPLENMDGMYAFEVVSWWIDNVKIMSPTLFGGEDVVQQMLDEAKAQKNPELDQLLNAPHDRFKSQKKIRKQTEYWIPILVLDWELQGDDILGIWDNDGNPDVALIDKYVRDGEGKILTCKIQMTKAINREATTRGGSLMFDREKGFNLILGKTGEGRETNYTASKADYLPMPEKYYGEGTPDVVNICKAGIFTDEYIDNIVGQYLYGDQPMEKNDSCYRYPEIRAMFKSDNEAEAAAPKPARPSRAPKATEDIGRKPATETADEAPAEAPPETEPEAAPAEEKQPSRPSRSARPATKADVNKGTTRRAAAGRNVTQDLNDV